MVGYAVLSANNDQVIEYLAFLSQIEKDCPTEAEAIFDTTKDSLKRYLGIILDQYLKKNNLRYLDTTKT